MEFEVELALNSDKMFLRRMKVGRENKKKGKSNSLVFLMCEESQKITGYE